MKARPTQKSVLQQIADEPCYGRSTSEVLEAKIFGSLLNETLAAVSSIWSHELILTFIKVPSHFAAL